MFSDDVTAAIRWSDGHIGIPNQFWQTVELFSFWRTFVCFNKFTAVTAAMRWSDGHVGVPNQFCRLLNYFLLKALSFVSINLHSCWPREGKRSISPWFKTHKLSSLLIRFVRCSIVTNYSSCACLFIETHNLQTFVICLMPVFIRTEGLTVSTKIVSSFQTPWSSYYVLKYNPSCAGPTPDALRILDVHLYCENTSCLYL